jgi:uncharacterized iron-regulated membrane protein
MAASLPEVDYHAPMKTLFRKIHRWLGLLVALQIIAWMASGLYFSIFPIAEIRGEHLTREPEALGPVRLDELAAPGSLAATLDRHFGDGWSLNGLRLARWEGKTVWRVEGSHGGEGFVRLVDPAGERVLPRLDEAGARRTARAWLLEDAPVTSLDLVTGFSPGDEYRGRILPVWKVALGGAEPVNLYLDPWTGEILARRTARWRLFDFLWMLHIMDFDERTDFNHPLLQGAAAFGLVVALSGGIFWAMTTRLFRRRRSVKA